jgi:hypothetical protein
VPSATANWWEQPDAVSRAGQQGDPVTARKGKADTDDVIGGLSFVVRGLRRLRNRPKAGFETAPVFALAAGMEWRQP